MRYAIITGSGRSGTNWLLDTLDASPETHCRNEPHGIPDSSLNLFPRVWTSADAGSEELYRARWDEVASATCRKFGKSDHALRYPKPYLHPLTNRFDLSRLMMNPRARHWTSRLDRRLRQPEWELPSWLGSATRLEQCLGILKVLLDAPLVTWILAERQTVPIVHIVRHPGGRLHSWLTRLIQPRSEFERANFVADRAARLRRIRAYDERWAALIPDPSTLTLVELEIWFWRYVNETTMAAGAGSDRYLMLRFDDLVHRPLACSQQLYHHMGLRWNDEIDRRVSGDLSRSVFGPVDNSRRVANAWRTGLDRAHIETIEEILAGSALRDLLDDTQ